MKTATRPKAGVSYDITNPDGDRAVVRVLSVSTRWARVEVREGILPGFILPSSRRGDTRTLLISRWTWEVWTDHQWEFREDTGARIGSALDRAWDECDHRRGRWA